MDNKITIMDNTVPIYTENSRRALAAKMIRFTYFNDNDVNEWNEKLEREDRIMEAAERAGETNPLPSDYVPL